jgi:NitT/TauT family transport system ATP-binding protein
VTTIRSHPRFVELHAQIWDAMREEVLKGYRRQMDALSE